jgi:hypothetical protein
MASDREKILELITKTMNEYDYREPSEEYASHEMLLLISRIKELPADEEIIRWAVSFEGEHDCDFADSQAARSKSAHFRTLGFESDYYRVAIRRLEDK